MSNVLAAAEGISTAWEGLRKAASMDRLGSLSSAVRSRFGGDRQPVFVHGNTAGIPHPAVSLGSFHELRSAIQRNATPASGQQLVMMEAVLREGLLSSGLVSAVEVEQTSEPDHLVIAMCELTRGHGPLEQLASRLEWIWDTQVRYRFWEAHTISVYADQIELSAATRPDATGNYVTVHLVAQTPPFPGQRSGAS